MQNVNYRIKIQKRLHLCLADHPDHFLVASADRTETSKLPIYTRRKTSHLYLEDHRRIAGMDALDLFDRLGCNKIGAMATIH